MKKKQIHDNFLFSFLIYFTYVFVSIFLHVFGGKCREEEKVNGHLGIEVEVFSCLPPQCELTMT